MSIDPEIINYITDKIETEFRTRPASHEFVKELADQLKLLIYPMMEERCKSCSNSRVFNSRFEALDDKLEAAIALLRSDIATELTVLNKTDEVSDDKFDGIKEHIDKLAGDLDMYTNQLEYALAGVRKSIEDTKAYTDTQLANHTTYHDKNEHRWGVLSLPKQYPVKTIILIVLACLGLSIPSVVLTWLGTPRAIVEELQKTNNKPAVHARP